MTTIEQAHAQLVDALRSYRQVLSNETEAVDLVLGTLAGKRDRATFEEEPAPPRKRRTAKPAPREPKAESQAKAAKRHTKLPAPKAIDEPTSRVGRLPAKVKVRAFEDETERRKFVEGLVEKGYTRTKPMARLAPGLFDVIHTSSDVSVTWWPEEAE